MLHIGSYLDFNTFTHDNLYGIERNFRSLYNNHKMQIKLTFLSDGEKYFIMNLDGNDIITVKLTCYDEDYNNKCINEFKKNFMRRMLGGR